MASAKQLNDAFITDKIRNDMDIEKATRKNIKRIESVNQKEIHKNLLKVLGIESINHSIYFDISAWISLIDNINSDIKERNKKKKEEEKAKKKAADFDDD